MNGTRALTSKATSLGHRLLTSTRAIFSLPASPHLYAKGSFETTQTKRGLDAGSILAVKTDETQEI